MSETDTISRPKSEIEARLERLREYEPVSGADHQANRASIRMLEWVLSVDEAKDMEDSDDE